MLAPPLLAWLALVGPQAPGGGAEPAPSLLAALPGDALFVVAVEDFASLWERAPRTAWGRLASEPVLAPLWSQVDTLVQGELDPELSARTALDALQGGAFYIGPPQGDVEHSLGLVLRLRPGFPALARALRKNVTRAVDPHEAVDFEGRALFVGRGGHAGSWEVYFEWSQGIGVVETGGRENALELARTLVRRLEAGTSGGVLSARLEGRRPANRSTVEAYLNVGAWLATILEPNGAQETRRVAALQLDGFGWSALHFALGEGSAFDLNATLELPPTGLWPLLAARARPAPTRLARLAPDDTIELATLGYDARGAWHDLEAWLAPNLPDFHEELVRTLTTTSNRVDIDLRQELFAQLSGEFGRFLLPLPDDRQTEAPGFTGFVSAWLFELFGSPAAAAADVYLVGLEDVPVVEGLVEKLLAQKESSLVLREEELGGSRLHFFEAPELGLEPSWAFVDDVLVLSTQRAGVRAVLQQAASGEPTQWIDDEHTAALRADVTAVGSSVADVAGLIRVRMAGPLERLLALTAEQPAPAAGLQELVEEHVHGRARTTVSVRGRELRYRFWSN